MSDAKKSARLRWKQDSPERGLAAVGAAPRSHWLHDGTKRYACVSAKGGSWRGPLLGWYFVAGWDSGVTYRNTCEEPLFPDVDAAKAAAMKYVMEELAKLKD